MRILIYEYASAQSGAAALPESIRVEGREMLRCLVEDFGRIPGVEVITLENDEPNAFRQQAAAADWSLVIAPEFDGILFERCRAVEEAGGRLLGPSCDDVRIAGDKWETYQLFQRYEVPTPHTVMAEDTAEWRYWPTPLVRKPRYGAGSRSVQLIADSRELAAESGFLIQQFVTGTAASVAFIIGSEGAIPLLPGYQRLSKDGRFRYEGGSIPLPVRLAERAVALGKRALAAMPGLSGYVGVDLIIDEGPSGDGDTVIEINPRLTTSYVGLRELAEDNLAEVMLQVAVGEWRRPIRWRPGSVRFVIEKPGISEKPGFFCDFERVP